jgi:hypothetical protein
VLLVLAAVAVVTLLLTAFGTSRKPAPTARQTPLTDRLLPAGPPRPQVVAVAGPLRIDLPVAQTHVTGIGYHGAGETAIPLAPVGRQANEGVLGRWARRLFGGGSGGVRYYQLSGGDGPSTGMLDVGAAAGTDVYSPVDGTVIAITPTVLDGRRYGAAIDIQPTGAPSLVVEVDHLRPDPSLTVGSALVATTSKLGTVVDFSTVEQQALARYTHDAGNHVSVTVSRAAATAIP